MGVKGMDDGPAGGKYNDLIKPIIKIAVFVIQTVRSYFTPFTIGITIPGRHCYGTHELYKFS